MLRRQGNLDMSRNLIVAWMAIVVLTTGSAGAGILVDHPPHPYGGPYSDTELYYYYTGEVIWAQVADDIFLGADALATKLVFFGFYGSNVIGDGTVEPPAGAESFRLRLYDARASDGLPGNTLYEETVTSTLRAATGRRVLDSRYHPEFRFEIELAQAIELNAGIRYWLEIVQLDVAGSVFRWEESLGVPQDGVAAEWSYQPDWYSGPAGLNTAFELYDVPEPKATVLILMASILVRSTSKPEGRRS